MFKMFTGTATKIREKKEERNTEKKEKRESFEAEQFIASSRSSSLSSLPLPPLHHSNNAFTTPFVIYPTTTATLLHQQSPTQKIIEENTNCVVVDYLESTSSSQRDRLAPELVDSWSNDELLSLFRIRSSFENWFPEFTWELVSRKLAELGFKRSAGKCKEKFEEESSTYLNNINYNKNTTSDMVFSEFQELYKPNQEEQKGGGGEEEDPRINDELLIDAIMNSNDHEEAMMFVEKSNNKKRKRQKKKKKKKKKEKFEMFKSLCEDVVNNLMTQQEEMQNKLIEDMVKRDEEKVAREEALKKQEMDMIHKELEFRAHEEVVASDGQASLINYLKLFTSPSSTATPCDLVNHKVQNPNPTTITKENPIAPTSLADDLAPQNPNLASTTKKSRLCSDVYKEDIGRRWPREEVMALINLRCNLCDTNHHHQENINIKEGGGGGGLLKAPLWERISECMLDLGYKRSPKRCKEKWENINKYFRKTKDISKKRSLESRTCPYFQRLSTFYTQKTLVPPPSTLLENPWVDSSINGSNNSTMDGLVVGEKNMVQVVPPAAAAFEFEF